MKSFVIFLQPLSVTYCMIKMNDIIVNCVLQMEDLSQLFFERAGTLPLKRGKTKCKCSLICSCQSEVS